MRWLDRLLGWLGIGSTDTPVSSTRLAYDTTRVSTVMRGELTDGVAGVSVMQTSPLAPVSGAPVRYRVLDGPLELGPAGETAATVRTDSTGRVAVTARMTEQGTAVLLAESPDVADDSVTLTVRTEGVAHELDLSFDRSVTADDEALPVSVSVLDHRRRPVAGARLHLEGQTGGDSFAVGTVSEVTPGRYEGSLPVDTAGEWWVAAHVEATDLVERRCVTVPGGEATQIDLVEEPDPRGARPYDEAVVRAVLRDAAGNALDPSRLVARVGDEAVDRWTVGTEARFRVRFAGAGAVDVHIVDTESSVSTEVEVPFAPFWFDAPDVVEAGSTFELATRTAPPPDRPWRNARLHLDFEPARVEIVDFQEAVDSGVSVTAHRIEDGTLVLDATADERLDAVEWPEGEPVGRVTVRCTTPERSCFTAFLELVEFFDEFEDAPIGEWAGWNTCPEQKHRAENVRCLCFNIITRPEHGSDVTHGLAMARQVLEVISNNYRVCCPVLHGRVDTCQLTEDQWEQITDGWVESPAYRDPRTGKPTPDVPLTERKPQRVKELDAILDSELCTKDGCLNIYVAELGPFYFLGKARAQANIPPAAIVVDPEKYDVYPSLAAHEAGHILTGNERHVNDRSNVMHKVAPYGSKFVRDQCKDIWENLEKYTCDSTGVPLVR